MTDTTKGDLSESEPKVRWKIVLRPVIIWTCISAVILGYDYDRVNAPKTFITPYVTLDDVPLESPADYSIKVDGFSLKPGNVVAVGNRTIEIRARDSTVFKTNLFAWYGENRLDSVKLKRLAGQLNLTITPPANRVELIGPYDQVVATNVSTIQTNIPVGQYEVTLSYGHFEKQTSITVEADKTVSRNIAPNVGLAIIDSSPLNAQFLLSSTNRSFRSQSGILPVSMSLEAGGYHLETWRGSYRKSIDLIVRRGTTNRVTVPFDYGYLDIKTKPPGVFVLLNSKRIGLSPTNTTLQPGSYNLRLVQAGLNALESRINITAGETLTIVTNLVNSSFALDLASAKRFASQGNYRQALERIDSAVSIDPSSQQALNLRSEYQREVTRITATEAIEAKRKSNEDLFGIHTKAIEHASLFETHSWRFKQDFRSVRDAVRRAIPKTGGRYTIEHEQNLGQNTVLFRGRSKGLTANGRHCVVLVAENGQNETQVVIKLWDYASGTTSGISIAAMLKLEKYIPVHPQFFPENQRQSVLERRRKLPTEFRATLENELKLSGGQ